MVPVIAKKLTFIKPALMWVNAASGFQLLCHSRILYGNAEKTIGAVCRVADERYDSEGGFYFFTLRQTDFDYLRPFEKRYVVLGCGSSAQTLQILDRTFESWRGRRLNIYVRNKNGRYILHPKGRDERIDVTDTLIEADSGDRG